MSFRVSLGFFLMVSLFSYNNMHTSSYTLRLLFLCSLHEIYICDVLHEMLSANYNTKTQQTPRAK